MSKSRLPEPSNRNLKDPQPQGLLKRSRGQTFHTQNLTAARNGAQHLHNAKADILSENFDILGGAEGFVIQL